MQLRSRNPLLTCLIALAVCLPTLAFAAPGVAGAKASAPVVVPGNTTRWNLQLLSVHVVPRFADVPWRGYYSEREFVILNVRMTNTGSRAADLYDDVQLAVRVLPGYPTRYMAGWSSLPHCARAAQCGANVVFDQMYRSAQRTYGGTLPWVGTSPRQSTTYIYVIGAAHEAHYGLYYYTHSLGLTFLTDTGV